MLQAPVVSCIEAQTSGAGTRQETPGSRARRLYLPPPVSSLLWQEPPT